VAVRPPEPAPSIAPASSVASPSPDAAASAGEAGASGPVVLPPAQAAPNPSVPPVATPVAPPPLKPLAERTAKADGAATTAAQPADGAKTVSPAVAASPADAGSFPDQRVESVEAAPTTTQEAAPRGDHAPLSSLETSASQPAPQAARDLSPSGMSRGAIDATAQIAAQILRKLEGRSTRFEMALTPDHLGRVDVKLDIDSEGRLAARLAFDNPAAATDLRGRADDLRRQLETQGFQLAEDAFEFTQRDSGSHAFDRGQDPRGHARAFTAAARLNAETDSAPPVWTALSLSPSGVDMKV
jgi:flagellar hook-length control protein FliK